MEARLHNAQEILQRSQLLNVHTNVDVGRVAAYKANIVTLTTLLFLF